MTKPDRHRDGNLGNLLPNKRMQLAARTFSFASAAGRRPFDILAGVAGLAAGRRAVYGQFTAGVS
jgi:hypothetical protein